VSDAEAGLLLATHDPLAALAEYDKPRLQTLFGPKANSFARLPTA